MEDWMNNKIIRWGAISAATVQLLSVVLLLVGCDSSLVGSESRSQADPVLERVDVSFTVSNPQEGNAERILHGYRINPRCRSDSAILLLHGLSYTSEAWDFRPDLSYSYARTLADAGYTVIAIDRLGYGRSVLENGYLVSIHAHAQMAQQVVLALREEFAHVAIGGHSFGSIIAQTVAGTFGGVDAVIGMGFFSAPSDEYGQDYVSGDLPRALQSDYSYFLGTPEHRAEMFYTAQSDPEIIAADTASAVLTPSGDFLSALTQLLRAQQLIAVPVLLQHGDSDRIFPVDNAEAEILTFISAPSVTLDIVSQSGHTYMLHHSGPKAGERVAEWLRTQLPACGT